MRTPNHGLIALLPVVSLIALHATGCRNLSLPEERTPSDGTGGEGLLLLEPDEIALSHPLPRSTQFRLSASSLNGVNLVDLRCGDRVVALWNTEGRGAEGEPVELQAFVNFQDCVGVGDGTLAQEEVLLRIRALDGTNLEFADFERTVLVDFTEPVLTAALPERVVAGENLSFTVRSDIALQGVPHAVIDGVAATVELKDPIENLYRVTHTRALELGASRLPPDQLANTAELEESNRPVSVQITARSYTGNEGRLDATLTLSRVAWQRSVPGLIVSAPVVPSDPENLTQPSPLHAVASDAGVTVPLHASLNQDAGLWVPGFFDVDDGAYAPMHASLEGSHGIGLDEGGGALMIHRTAGAIRRVAFGGAPVETYAVADPSGFVRNGEAWCEHLWTGSAGTCGGNSSHDFVCIGPGQTSRTSVATGSGVDFAESPGRYQFKAGPNFFSLEALAAFDTTAGTHCSSPVGPSFRIADGNVEKLAPLRTEFVSLIRVLPSERGDFAVVLQDGDNQSLVTHWGLEGTTMEGSLGSVDYFPSTWVNGGFTVPFSAPLTYRPDGTILRFPLDVSNGLTRVGGQGANGAQLGTATFHGYFEPLRDSLRSFYPHGVFTLTDSPAPDLRYTSYILVHRNGRNSGFFSVLAIDHLMRPKWVYHHPRQLPVPPFQGAPGTQKLQLVGSSASKYVYLIDEGSSEITALAR